MNHTNHQPEFSLDLLRAGDRKEQARLVDFYSSPVYRIAMNILNSAQDAEDILQETFINVFHGLRTFEGRSSLTTWIYRIAVNEALMLIRKRKGIEISIDEDKEDEGGATPPNEIIDWSHLPEKELLSNEMRNVLNKQIGLLPNKLRIVFVLRDMEDLSIKDTAQTLGLSESAVKTRLLRARLQLRENISRYISDRKPEKQVSYGTHKL
jgi:RNA polymerase sigma-70 factor, ECF subfamily